MIETLRFEQVGADFLELDTGHVLRNKLLCSAGPVPSVWASCCRCFNVNLYVGSLPKLGFLLRDPSIRVLYYIRGDLKRDPTLENYPYA